MRGVVGGSTEPCWSGEGNSDRKQGHLPWEEVARRPHSGPVEVTHFSPTHTHDSRGPPCLAQCRCLRVNKNMSFPTEVDFGHVTVAGGGDRDTVPWGVRTP